MSAFIANLKTTALIKKITADDAVPVAATQLKEISDLTLQSGKDCDTVRSVLLDRLDGTSADVRLKALKAIRHVALYGNPDFRIALSRNSEVIKDHQCTSFFLLVLLSRLSLLPRLSLLS